MFVILHIRCRMLGAAYMCTYTTMVLQSILKRSDKYFCPTMNFTNHSKFQPTITFSADPISTTFSTGILLNRTLLGVFTVDYLHIFFSFHKNTVFTSLYKYVYPCINCTLHHHRYLGRVILYDWLNRVT